MESSTLASDRLISAVGQLFYTAVPAQYQTYCVFTSSICRQALQQLGVPAQVVPCELWYAGANSNYVLGFSEPQDPGKWPGHAICITEGWMIDTALRHFTRLWGLEVPSVVVQKTFALTSNVISRYDLGTEVRLWWHRPPFGLESRLPEEPAELIERYSRELVNVVRHQLALMQTPHEATTCTAVPAGSDAAHHHASELPKEKWRARGDSNL